MGDAWAWELKGGLLSRLLAEAEEASLQPPSRRGKGKQTADLTDHRRSCLYFELLLVVWYRCLFGWWMCVCVETRSEPRASNGRTPGTAQAARFLVAASLCVSGRLIPSQPHQTDRINEVMRNIKKESILGWIGRIIHALALDTDVDPAVRDFSPI